MTSRDALIVVNAVTQDPRWRPLIGVEQAAKEFARVLGDASIGGFDDVSVLRDEPAHVLMGGIERFLHGRSPGDLLLMYFCGYLAPDDRENPYFVTTDSIPDRLSSTALDMDFVKMWLDRCLSRRVVLFLDLGFPSVLGWDVGRRREQPDLSALNGLGRVVIAAPPPSVGYAAEPADVGSRSSDTSAFTQALIDGLRTGDADRDRDGIVGLGELYEHLHERVREAGVAAPSKWDQIEGDVAVATAPRRDAAHEPAIDHDGISDAYEQHSGLDPLSADTDADGLADAYEILFGSDPLSADTDADGLADEFEILFGSDPLSADTDDDGVSHLEQTAPSAAAAPPVIDRDVQFTVYSPRQLVAEHWAPLLVYAHKGEPFVDPWGNPIDPVQEVDQRARALLATEEEPRLLRADLQQALARGTSITIAPDFPMLRCNPSFVTLDWLEPIHEVPFRILAPAGLRGTEVRGWVRLWCGSVILAEVSITIPVRQDGQPDPKNPPRADQMRTDQMRRYRKIFPSYSHRDREVVDQFRNAAIAIGDDYLMDVVALRSGENWRAALSGLINEADVFQLFWSSNSMRSPHCRAEWEHALALARPEFIRPVFWEVPMPRAPELGLPTPELSRLHFARLPALTSRAAAPNPATPHAPAPNPPAPEPVAPSPLPPAGPFGSPRAGQVDSEWVDDQWGSQPRWGGQPQGAPSGYSYGGPADRPKGCSRTVLIVSVLVAGLIAALVIGVLVIAAVVRVLT